MRYYCTLFDSNYLLKGLAMYRSLVRHAESLTLYILCMDERSYELLSQLNLEYARLVRHVDFEDEELKALKPTRTVAEYCWTCTSSLVLYVLEHELSADIVTYLDADIYFFSNPEPIFDEMGDDSVLIVEHRFIERLKHLDVNGKYNVEFVSFRRDENGMACLKWWRERCNEWCFNRLEDGKLGDQKYLDEWPDRFGGVHVLEHIGAGVGPWNFSQYDIEIDDKGNLLVNGLALIFYHFHQFQMLSGKHYFHLSDNYLLEKPTPTVIYHCYERALEAALSEAQAVVPGFRSGITAYFPIFAREMVRRYLPVTIKNWVKRYLVPAG